MHSIGTERKTPSTGLYRHLYNIYTDVYDWAVSKPDMSSGMYIDTIGVGCCFSYWLNLADYSEYCWVFEEVLNYLIGDGTVTETREGLLTSVILCLTFWWIQHLIFVVYLFHCTYV